MLFQQNEEVRDWCDVLCSQLHSGDKVCALTYKSKIDVWLLQDWNRIIHLLFVL